MFVFCPKGKKIEVELRKYLYLTTGSPSGGVGRNVSYSAVFFLLISWLAAALNIAIMFRL